MTDVARRGVSDPAPVDPAGGGPLVSERVIVNSAMSFAGSAQRAWRMRESAPPGPARWVLSFVIGWLIIPSWWLVVLAWYAVVVLPFWWLAFPYRLLRRGARKRKAEALRHREVLQALEKSRE